MNARLEWSDDWLVLVAGPWRFSVADIEVYGDGRATAYLRSWVPSAVGASALTPEEDNHCDIGEQGAEILCASREEAVAVIRALLSVRGVECPNPSAVS